MTARAPGLFELSTFAVDVRPELRKAIRELRVEVRQFIASEIANASFTPQCDSWLRGHDPAFTRRMADRGWIGMTWPERYGGGGRSAVERHAVLEELMAAGAPVSAHLVADRQTGPLLLRYGSAELKDRFLPAIVKGECFFCIGMSEPDAGSDLSAVRTRAERVAHGWVVWGRKVWTSHADRSHYMLALCRTGGSTEDRHAGLSQLIIDLRAPGVSIRPIALMTGETHFAEVTLDGVEVSEEMLVGESGQGWVQVTSELALERSGPERYTSVVPLLRTLVDEARKDRNVASKTVGRLASRLAAVRRLAVAIAAAFDAGRSPIVEAAVVKDLGTRFELSLIDLAREVAALARSPMPLTRRHLAEAVIGSPAFTLRGGTNEILRGIVARGLL